jgi:P4 family phage/plasmid primase-like protien
MEPTRRTKAARDAKTLAQSAPAPTSARVIDPFEVSRLFMMDDLKKSGLVLADFEAAGLPSPEPLAAYDGVARYRLHYGEGNFFKDRYDRGEAKYQNAPGVTPPAVKLGQFEGAKLTASVEGLKKALLFYVTTGIPTLVLDSCHGWGEKKLDFDNLAELSDLKDTLQETLSPDSSHIVLIDGDWARNDQVGRALAMYCTLLTQHGVKPTPLDLGRREGYLDDPVGYDDWFVGTYDTVRSFWPDHKTTLKALIGLPRVAVESLEVYRSWATANADRLGTELLDLTHRGTASLLLKLHGRDNLCYLTDAGRWLFWGGRRWKDLGKQPLDLINAATKHYLDRSARLKEQAARTTSDEKRDQLLAEASSYSSWALGTCSSTRGRKDLLEDLKSRHALHRQSSDFDADPDLLGVANGVVDLRTGELRAEGREDLVLKHCPVEYKPGAIDPRLTKLLEEITSTAHGAPAPDRLRYLQRRIGAALRGVCSLAALEMWHGEGANGKSVIAKLIQAVLGTTSGGALGGGYGVQLDPAVVLSTWRGRDPEASTPFRMQLRGARVAFMAETADTAHFNEALVKQLTGGDGLTGRGNYLDPTSINATFTLFLVTNALPHVTDGDKAFWDRAAPFAFRCRWRRPDRVECPKEEMGLPVGDRWWNELAVRDAQVLEALLAWMVQGCVEWIREGLGEAPEDVRKDLQEYRDEQDWWERWMADKGLVLDPTGDVSTSYLYSTYADWTKAGGGVPVRDQVFSTRLLKRFPSLGRVKQHGLRKITGIRSVAVLDTGARGSPGVAELKDGNA